MTRAIGVEGEGIGAHEQVNVEADGQHGNQAVLLHMGGGDLSGVGNVIVIAKPFN